MPKYRIDFRRTDTGTIDVDAVDAEAAGLYLRTHPELTDEVVDGVAEISLTRVAWVKEPKTSDPTPDPSEALKTFIEGLGKAVEDGLKEITAAVRDAIKEKP